jgi:hypothetical protein
MKNINYHNYLAISQDLHIKNGHNAATFWERVVIGYNVHLLVGCNQRPSHYLEMKWGCIKHDIAKFVNVYEQVLNVRKFGLKLDDNL